MDKSGNVGQATYKSDLPAALNDYYDKRRDDMIVDIIVLAIRIGHVSQLAHWSR